MKCIKNSLSDILMNYDLTTKLVLIRNINDTHTGKLSYYYYIIYST